MLRLLNGLTSSIASNNPSEPSDHRLAVTGENFGVLSPLVTPLPPGYQQETGHPKFLSSHSLGRPTDVRLTDFDTSFNNVRESDNAVNRPGLPRAEKITDFSCFSVEIRLSQKVHYPREVGCRVSAWELRSFAIWLERWKRWQDESSSHGGIDR
jgi:hypothetical protein